MDTEGLNKRGRETGRGRREGLGGGLTLGKAPGVFQLIPAPDHLPAHPLVQAQGWAVEGGQGSGRGGGAA